MENENYDVIVIGSGMGGLTFASLAALLSACRKL
jgi:phytoene dehydrogenase-like protein